MMNPFRGVTRAGLRPGAAVVAFATLILGLGLALVSSRMVAALVAVPESTPGMLSLWTEFYPVQLSDMAPGEAGYVQLDVQLDDADRGNLALQVRKDGDLATIPGGITITVEECDVSWSNVPAGTTVGGAPLCPSGHAVLLVAGTGDDYAITSPTWDLGDILDEVTVHLLVTLALPSSTPASSVEGLSATFGFGLLADGESAVPPGPLAMTGADVFPFVLVAVGAVGLGFIFSGSKSRKELT